MGYSYKETVKIFGKEKADMIFDKAGLNKGRIKMTEEEKKSKHYLKMTEEQHGKIIHKRLEEKGILHSHVGNESGQSGSKNIIIMMSKKKALGVSKGYPDYFIYIPFKEGLVTLVVELKKAPGAKGGWNGSTFKIEQAEWLNNLQKVPFTWVALCQGSEQVINLVDDMIEKLKNKNLLEVLELWKEKETIDFITKINS